jgi:integrase
MRWLEPCVPPAFSDRHEHRLHRKCGRTHIFGSKPVGLVKRSAHGLRKAAARRFAELGANEATLNAIFGWSDPRMAAYYVRQADMKSKALAASRWPTNAIRAGY